MSATSKITASAALIGALAAGCGERMSPVSPIHENAKYEASLPSGYMDPSERLKRIKASYGVFDAGPADFQAAMSGAKGGNSDASILDSYTEQPVAYAGFTPRASKAAAAAEPYVENVTDVYSGEPVRVVMRVENEDGTADHYWTPPVLNNETRQKIAAKKAIRPLPEYPRISVDGGTYYDDVDTEQPVTDIQLIPKHTSQYGEDLTQTLRNVVGYVLRFEDEIRVYAHGNPPSKAVSDSLSRAWHIGGTLTDTTSWTAEEYGDAAAAGISSWQPAIDAAAQREGIPSPVRVRMVNSEDEANVVVVYEGKRRSDGLPIPIGQYALGETKRDENGRPIKAYIYVNPTLSIEGVGSVAAHEFGHAALDMHSGMGSGTYAGGHIPYAGPSNNNIMASIPFVSKPSDFEGMLALTVYKLNQGALPWFTYSENDMEIRPPKASPDVDGDGDVDFGDFLDFAMMFGTTNMENDYDNNGRVDFGDFLDFAQAFGKQGEDIRKYETSESERQAQLAQLTSEHPAARRR